MSDSFKAEADNQDENAVKETTKPKPQAVCNFFARGWCKFGHRCRFLHQRNSQPLRNKTSKTYPAAPKRENEGLREATDVELPAEVAGATAELKNPDSRLICKFYLKHNYCGYGNRCKFSHDAVKSEIVKEENLEAQAAFRDKKQDGKQASTGKVSQPNSQNGQRKAKKPLCRYIKRGGCYLGDRCKFFHPATNLLDDVTDNIHDVKLTQEETNSHVDGVPVAASVINEQAVKPRVSGYHGRGRPRRTTGPLTQFQLADLQHDDVIKLRQREMDQLKKRYPNAVTFVDEKGRDGFTFTFVPTDPDWPYDVKLLKLNILFPSEYPKIRLQVRLPDDEQVPETVKRQVWFSMQDWLRSRFARLAENGQVELVFKPLLKLLDRSLEDLFTEGLKLYQKELMAKASGIELVSASILNDTYNQSSDEEEEEDQDEEEDDDEYEDADSGTEDGDESEDDESEEEEADESDIKGGSLDPVKRGIEVKLQQLQLKASASTMRIFFTKLVLQCGRCKNNMEVSMPTSRPAVVICSKCHEEQLVQLRPGIVHQFSAVIGYLDTDNCFPVDLILTDCHFMIGCIECSKETKLEGLPPGQLKTMWCTCHKKLQVAVETTRFTQLQASDLLDTRGALLVREKKRTKKDPAIQEGKPLPGTGTCKHYKKSFRWLRFPCCGKAYPCDECHDEEEDHDMQFANRMICGFCAKEQVFAANRDCICCGANMTKKGSAFWEGGKGCRDRIKMARTDRKKYANANKTVSKKSQTKPGTGGKRTKLRHL